MSTPKFFCACFALLLVMLTASCAPIKNLDVWKDETYAKPLKKVLIIVRAREKSVREQAENVLANQLSDRGVEVVRSYKVLPDLSAKLPNISIAFLSPGCPGTSYYWSVALLRVLGDLLLAQVSHRLIHELISCVCPCQ